MINEHDICIKGELTPSSQRARSFGFVALGERSGLCVRQKSRFCNRLNKRAFYKDEGEPK